MSGKYQYKLSIAGIPIQLNTEHPLAEEKAFESFLQEDNDPYYVASFHKTLRLDAFSETIIHESHCYRVHPDGNGGCIRSFYDVPRDDTPYALASYDYEHGKIQVDYLEKGEKCVSEMSNSFFHLGIEALMLRENRLCFHAACVDTNLGGLLFSGVSGSGKSTQAELWCKYRSAKLINGDRPIISKEETGYYAWGSPYAGSSRCYVNERCQISAIVMLRQSSSCHLRRLQTKEAFNQIYKGLTIYSWDRQFVETAADMAIEMTWQIPVYEFSCTADENAVDYLENELQREKI